MPGAMEKPRSMHKPELMYATAPIGPISKPGTVDSAQAFVPDGASQANMGKGTMSMNDSAAAMGFMNPDHGPTLNPSSFAPQMPDMNNFAPISPENHTPTPPPNGSPVSPGASPRSGTTSPSLEKKIMMPIGTERHKQHQQRKTQVVYPASMGGDLVNPLSSTGVGSIWSYQSAGDKGSGRSSWYGIPEMDDDPGQMAQGVSLMQSPLPGMTDQNNLYPGQLSMVPPQMNAYIDIRRDPMPSGVPLYPQMPFQPSVSTDGSGLWNTQVHPVQNEQSLVSSLLFETLSTTTLVFSV
ncbi:hypothetical protein BSL78_28571 [Apostichopus japonicus]|uniref:Uncharacterized protein n=1 Tax=Stichopus japonicus TaxID=307972 RepID=A0A2G8JFS2_STIJA|nr:hypothetical protein BSL78_28571 [Apostichopus japonicus]